MTQYDRLFVGYSLFKKQKKDIVILRECNERRISSISLLCILPFEILRHDKS
jgi:hypothetical protein